MKNENHKISSKITITLNKENKAVVDYFQSLGVKPTDLINKLINQNYSNLYETAINHVNQLALLKNKSLTDEQTLKALSSFNANCCDNLTTNCCDTGECCNDLEENSCCEVGDCCK